MIFRRTDTRMRHIVDTNLIIYYNFFYRWGKLWPLPTGDKIKVYIYMRQYSEHWHHSSILVVLYGVYGVVDIQY